MALQPYFDGGKRFFVIFCQYSTFSLAKPVERWQRVGSFFFFTVMTKSDMIAQIADAAGITKKAAGVAYETLFELITTALKQGDKVTITGFGTFSVVQRAERMGVNPRNPQERIKIPAMKLPTFRAGKALKDSVR